jgi:hypothetical protein
MQQNKYLMLIIVNKVGTGYSHSHTHIYTYGSGTCVLVARHQFHIDHWKLKYLI